MSQTVLIILGIYLLACYSYGMLLLYRLWSTKTTVRPTSRLEATDLVRAAKQELEQEHEQDEQRVAA